MLDDKRMREVAASHVTIAEMCTYRARPSCGKPFGDMSGKHMLALKHQTSAFNSLSVAYTGLRFDESAGQRLPMDSM